ncbi:hypothetical protein [Natronobiforma cellulositropha]|uniref:hypothetical protein n=1 Tax=Natronobiforma cellulositropha TaxID=1679076 RepID=UPI0021D60054|nr:hypothetical protein [Natronobiforma cellulositropha]
MSSTFRTAVKTNVSRTQRRAAIDSLVSDRERASLAILVQTDGLRGEFRRQALAGLSRCNATAQLADLADDTTLPESLRRRAEELS